MESKTGKDVFQFVYVNLVLMASNGDVDVTTVPCVKDGDKARIVVRTGTGVPRWFVRGAANLDDVVTNGLSTGKYSVSKFFSLDSEGALPQEALQKITLYLGSQGADPKGRTWRIATDEEAAKAGPAGVDKSFQARARELVQAKRGGVVPVATGAVNEEMALLREQNRVLAERLAAFEQIEAAKAEKARIDELVGAATATLLAQVEALKAEIASRPVTVAQVDPEVLAAAIAQALKAQKAAGK